ncbi:MAG TPA: hypothetical protein VIL25_02115 [Vicinamibacterales bacterium]
MSVDERDAEILAELRRGVEAGVARLEHVADMLKDMAMLADRAAAGTADRIGELARNCVEAVDLLRRAVDAAAEDDIVFWAGMHAALKFRTNYLILAALLFVEPLWAGSRVLDAAEEGGRARRRGPADDVLVAAVRALHEKNPRLSWAACCARVGQRYGLSRRTVEMRARAADWRAR